MHGFRQKQWSKYSNQVTSTLLLKAVTFQVPLLEMFLKQIWEDVFRASMKSVHRFVFVSVNSFFTSCDLSLSYFNQSNPRFHLLYIIPFTLTLLYLICFPVFFIPLLPLHLLLISVFPINLTHSFVSQQQCFSSQE